MKKLALGLLFISLISQAVIRIVRGGGLAEMQFISLHQNLNQYLQVCVEKENPCELTLLEMSSYQMLFNRHKQDSQNYSIEFIPKMPAGTYYSLINSKLIIGSQSLYYTNSEPHEIKKLLAFIIAIRLDINSSPTPFVENYKRALQIFQNLNQRQQFYRATGMNTLLMVHVYDVRFASFRTKKFFLEDPIYTHDFSQLVKEKIPCGNLEDWQFNNWKNAFGVNNEAYFLAEASSPCSMQSGIRSTLVFKMRLNNKGLAIPESFEASFRY